MCGGQTTALGSVGFLYMKVLELELSWQAWWKLLFSLSHLTCSSMLLLKNKNLDICEDDTSNIKDDLLT